MKLVIAEKPSVAKDVATVLGSKKRENGFYSGDKYLVSWCVGHLVQNAMPEQYDPNLKKWSLNTLPFIPIEWKTTVSATTKAQYKVLDSLLKRNDVTEIVCATDAGREGELIFRLVYDKSNSKKPVKRLWISSMEDEAILNGFSNLKNASEYDSLYEAALSRMRADYLVGINATRLFTCLYNKKLSIGRVQTPTVNLIVKRQHEIDNFVPVPFFNAIADCHGFKAINRIEDELRAEEIGSKCNGKDGVISSFEKHDKKDNPSPLYDLTTLQREANKLLGYSAQQTLDIVQRLYEMKLSTYPRTDSRYLTEDMRDSTKKLIDGLRKSKAVNPLTIGEYNSEKVNVGKVINNSKVTDHHAIIPTSKVLETDIDNLPVLERSILYMIIYKLLSSVYSPKNYTQTKLVVTIEGEDFKATGNQIIDKGYTVFEPHLKELLGLTIKNNTDTNDIPPNIQEGTVIERINVSLEKKHTKPPKAYTEGTLLAAMENAGRLIDDQELKDAIKEGGLGTPATRSGIIERIIKVGYIERKGKSLLPTAQAIQLMALLPESIKEPTLTAEWEKLLDQIHQKQYSSKQFMTGINDYVRSFVSGNMKVPENSVPEAFQTQKEIVGKCPRCGKDVLEYSKTYSCESGKNGCGFTMWKEDRFFKDKKKKLTKTQASKLLSTGKVSIKGLYSPKKDKKYDATVVLNDTGKYVNYKLEF